MSGAEGIAGLALSAVSVTALFTTCIECYSLVVTAREFGEDYELLCTELSLQKLRFFLWGESVGLASRTSDSQPRPNPGLDDPLIQPTIIRTLNAIKSLLSETQEYDARYGFREEESTAGPSSRGLSIFRGTFDQFRNHARRNQAQKSVATITRWAIFDADNFEVKISRLKGFIDGLESVTRSLVTLETQHSRVREEIESLDDVESLRLVRDASNRNSQDVSDTASHRLSILQARQSLDSTVSTFRSSISTSNRSFYSAQATLDEESTPIDHEVETAQDALDPDDESRLPESTPSDRALHPGQRNPRQRSWTRLRRFASRPTIIEERNKLLHQPRAPTQPRPCLYKIVVLGDGGVGKTAIAIQFSSRHFVTSYDPTIEDSYRKSVVLDGEQCVVEILDTAGQEEYTALRDQWIRDGEAFVLVYNIWSRSSFTRITRFHNQIQRIKEGASQQPSYPGSPILPAKTPRKIPTMLVGHDYQDEVEAAEEKLETREEGSRTVNEEVPTREREVREAEGRSLAMELGCEYLEASAERCINIDKVFFDLVRGLRNQRVASKTSMVLN